MNVNVALQVERRSIIRPATGTGPAISNWPMKALTGVEWVKPPTIILTGQCYMDQRHLIRQVLTRPSEGIGTSTSKRAIHVSQTTQQS